MNGGYLVPANAKKGTLIANIFRPFDLYLFVGGCLLSVALLAIFSSAGLWITLLCLLPGAVAGFLVIPIPNYHNVLCAILSMFNFYNNRRNFRWRGWCFYEYFKEDGKSK